MGRNSHALRPYIPRRVFTLCNFWLYPAYICSTERNDTLKILAVCSMPPGIRAVQDTVSVTAPFLLASGAIREACTLSFKIHQLRVYSELLQGSAGAFNLFRINLIMPEKSRDTDVIFLPNCSTALDVVSSGAFRDNE